MTYEDAVKWWKSKQLTTLADYTETLSNFRVVFACNSSVIEGANIDYHTTREVFEDNKITDFTGDLRDIMEIQNQKFAFEYVCKSLVERKPITVQFIKKVHRLLLYGCYDNRRWEKGERPGTFKVNDYCVGVTSEGSYPEYVEDDISELLDEVNAAEGSNVLISAAYLHLRFEQIHPFADGNGRVGRLLMNYYLMLHGYPPTVIFDEDKETYYLALTVFDKAEELNGFIDFIREETVKTWDKYIPDVTKLRKIAPTLWKSLSDEELIEKYKNIE